MRIEEELARSELLLATWASSRIDVQSTTLHVSHEERAVRMAGAAASTGTALVSNGAVGADLIRLPAGARFAPHTHPGHHILVVVAGEGTITHAGEVRRTVAGQAYLIEGAVPHGVGAITDHVILAVGAPHKRIDASDRMVLVGYEEVISPEGDLHCLLCGVFAELPQRLHDRDCPHCPCPSCAGLR
ncbi:cupin domain-containing protein [Micromonospora sp. NPDC048999]|uniref:cupin domain-containing protein n=1 Tax=Micromonospora sp. NPDC048999 TaxID=3155391 RepID=UPI0033D976A9